MFKKFAFLLLLSLASFGYATQTSLTIMNHASQGFIYAPFKIAAIAGIVTKRSGGTGCVNRPPAMNACGIDAGSNTYTIYKYASSRATTYVCLSSSTQLPVDNNHGSCATNDCAAEISFSDGAPVAKPIGGNCSQYSFPSQAALTKDLQTITILH